MQSVFGSLFGLVSFLVILGIMVLIHELGHFAVAKFFRVHVLAFSIGFGKRLFGFVHNGTDYKVCALPLGGYVMMQGETEMPGTVQTTSTGTTDGSATITEREITGDDGSTAIPVAVGRNGQFALTELPRWQRALIALAGPVSNFVLAFVILLFAGLFHFEKMEYLRGPAVLDYVPANTAASRAGLAPGDTVVHFDTVANPNWQDVVEHCGLNMKHLVPVSWLRNGQRIDGTILVDSLTEPEDLQDKMGLIPRIQNGPIVVKSVLPDSAGGRAGLQPADAVVSVDGHPFSGVLALLAYLRDQGGKPAVLQVLRGGQTLSLTVHPTLIEKRYKIGFAPEPPPSDVVRLPFGDAIHEAWKSSLHSGSMVVQVLRGLFTRHVSVRSMSGPVGIEQQVSEAAQRSVWELLDTTALISMNLGIFNLLPIPILDGGMLLFLLIEGIARRDVDARVKERVYQAAFVCIMLLFVFIMVNDISKLSIFTHRPS